ncbi:MAG: hypothetical protein U1F29_16455 [Planctomycetota bacterium]|mgnify:FL=1
MQPVQRLLALLAVVALPELARAQFAETFDGGHNEGNYVLWFNVYNYLRPTGGNPGAMLELDDVTTGSATCDQVDIAPTVWPSQLGGNFRALGIDTVGIDVNVRAGRYGGTFSVTLTSDPGTPGNSADDCSITYQHALGGPAVPGWVEYDFDVPSASTTIPGGWTVAGPCSGNPTAAWNTVMQDVDTVSFRIDAEPTSFCTFTNWILDVDNIRVGVRPIASFCAGDGVDPVVTTACPCGNVGTLGHGCGNSVQSGGALLASTGYAILDDVVLHGSDMPATVACIYLQGDALTDVLFGDGVRCTGGTLLRLRTRVNVGGASAFPDSTDTVTLSQRGGVTVGSGVTRYYQTYYRNAAAAFCPPETFNVTNGRVVVW